MSPWWNESGRPVRLAVAGLLLVLAVGPASEAFAQDRTARWLESQGFTDLLAIHLEERLQAAAGDADATSGPSAPLGCVAWLACGAFTRRRHMTTLSSLVSESIRTGAMV